ncbi:family 78 glycoside hydrolase catalytic domain [Parabacteroides acidifaciens]|uniref:Alpha-L-rhamnosidase n=1 Tax=Parabacteroides acidifaciens TaxID=2290935 RepID=A0A3D8HKS1_9BACT|nr:alpha-L-rhamnosidase C-terminal domain-containing protein [Parabacteroides acidifaciens]MBC8600250.1 family 78 glycoside hydrolase catalytic domain [Parabacteroides acidifaciens]RDU51197.1 alpha-L-rhamnosidase [Parabacteroides acidifaciens]
MKIQLILISLFLTVSLSAQQRDSRVREYLPPVRIVWQQESGLIRGADHLLLPGNGQSDLANRTICKMTSTDKQHPAILLDFGKELQGGLQIVTGMPASHEPVAIRVRFGESVSEAMCEIDGVNGATNDHAMRDFTIRLPWLGVMEVGNSGFRFVRIDLLDDSAELHLKEVRAISTFRDIPYKGSFRCNDERLNKIWQTGAYTVHLNMQEYLWDGIKRDRLVWVGDLHPEVMTVNTVFGYNEVVPKSLDLIRDITPLPEWMNGISSYSIWWLLIHRDWYYYHGDLVYLKEQKPYMTALLRHLISKVDADGVEKLDGNRFLDWPSNANPMAINAGLQALMVQAMKAGNELCTVLGENALASECQAMMEKMVKAASKVTKPLLKSGVAPDAPGSKQAASLLTLAGLMKPEEANRKYLSVNGAKGFSTFYGYYMLRAMAAAGDYRGAIDVIRQYWGAMIDLGATTFWEDFNMEWLPDASRIDELVPAGKKDIHGDYGAYCYKGFRHSLCHGWASGPTSWLSEYVLGVQVVEPGCRTVRITPHLGDLEWVEGTFPTPYGIITIRHEIGVDGQVKSRIDAPAEVKIIQ